MLNRIFPGFIVGCIGLTLQILNTIWVFIPFFPISLLKFLIPFKPWQKIMDRILTTIAEWWIYTNNGIQKLTRTLDIEVIGDLNFKRKDWYLVIANHRSWSDILILQTVFVGKIPFLKFFLKEQLKWVPLLGICWWGLDFPFMKRYTKSQIKKNPKLKGKDIETTKKSCEKFKTKPVSIMNFVEGTRFSESKHKRQNSPFEHLLKPKAGGIGYVMTIMGEQMHKIVDVTLVYPNQDFSFWDFLCGRVTKVKVIVSEYEITPDIVGNYLEDKQYRSHFQKWLNQVWLDKDQTIKKHLVDFK
jgi:1-acyl-sn-glycerol-3-phosphate acyltransferase